MNARALNAVDLFFGIRNTPTRVLYKKWHTEPAALEVETQRGVFFLRYEPSECAWVEMFSDAMCRNLVPQLREEAVSGLARAELQALCEEVERREVES